MPDIINQETKIKCPVCKNDCIKDAEVVISSLSSVFSGCPSCTHTPVNMQKPPLKYQKESCPKCGRRHIDDVIAHCYFIMREEGEIPKGLPLFKTGIPLVTPGFAMKSPPYLPKKSLVLQTPYAGCRSAKRIIDEVLEVKGVIRDNGVVPGVSRSYDNLKDEYEKSPGIFSNTLLAGCDVRCDVFFAGNVPFAVYKNQSAMHIEYPRGFDPKINSVCENVRQKLPKTFIDACCGAGTLGIAAALFGVNNVLFNDIWYPAAFWTGANLYSNRKMLDIDNFSFFYSFDELKDAFGRRKPLKTAHLSGRFCSFDVYLGDFMELDEVMTGTDTLAALDIFGKGDMKAHYTAVSEWKMKVGGDAFIP